MSASAEPTRLGDVLDAGFRVYRAHAPLLIGLAALTSLPMTLGSGLISQALFAMIFNSSRSLAASSLLIWLANLASGIVLALLLGVLQQGILVAALVPALGGHSPRAGAALRLGLRSYPALLPAALLPVLLERLIAACLNQLISPLAALAYTGSLVFNGVLWALLGILALPFAALLAALYGQLALYVPAVVFEQCGPVAALARSWTLTDGARTQAALLVLLGQALIHGFAALPWLVLAIVIGRLGLGTAALSIGGMFTALAGQLLVAPLSSAFFAALYTARRSAAPADALEHDVAAWASR